jgi:hypothetical protein
VAQPAAPGSKACSAGEQNESSRSQAQSSELKNETSNCKPRNQQLKTETKTETGGTEAQTGQ